MASGRVVNPQRGFVAATAISPGVECIKDAPLVVGICGKASIAHCLIEAAGVFTGSNEGPINVRVAHGLRLVWQAGWL